MVTQGGLFVKKQEMTKLRVQQRFVPVTLVVPVEQSVLRHKTIEKDGYQALVIQLKKNAKKSVIKELKASDAALSQFTQGSVLDAQMLTDAVRVRVTGISKGKGFQGVIKRHNFSGGPATHGSKFHRAGGSTGNRKPRRTNKGHPMAGQMGDETITLKSVPIVSILEIEGVTLIALKGSLPGAYGSLLQLTI